MSAQTDRLNAALAGRYSIERELGAGGMATVFLAEDLKHKRKVALKVLKPELAAVLGADRFVVEITTTAAMQHPHILPLFDSGTADSFLFYVMPFIEGETLRDKLNRETQLGVDEAVRIAREVLDALQYAHEHGIVHRDVKPENILLHGGHAMVADFGIALAVSAAAGGRMTETGLSLGTPHYMSPEQATAEKEITARSDVYSLGSVLYEMLTGQPPHIGGSAQQIIMKIITESAAPVTQLRKSVPQNVAAAVAKSLEKLPADRFESAKAFSEALGNSAYTNATLAGTAAAAPPANISFSFSIPRAKIVRVAKLATAVAAIALGAWGWLRRPADTAPLRMRFTIEIPDSLAPNASLAQWSLVLAPNGTEMVYPGARGALLRRKLNDLTVTELAETRGASNPRYSPDGRSLLFERGGTLIKMPLGGGPSTRIADSVVRPSWGDGGVIVFARPDGLWQVRDGGGKAVRLTSVDTSAGERLHTWPFVLPGSRAVVFEISTRSGTISDDELAVARLPDGRITKLGVKGNNARYVNSGHLLFTRQDGSIAAVPFDLASLRTRGDPMTVLDGIVVKTGGAGMFDVSTAGVLSYLEGASMLSIASVNRRGEMKALAATSGRFLHPRLSPSGDRVAVSRGAENGSRDIWILTLSTGQWFHLTHSGHGGSPEWSADGQRVVWIDADSAGNVLLWQRADGSGVPEAIPSKERTLAEISVAQRGDFLAAVGGVSGQRDIYYTPLGIPGAQRPLANGPESETVPSISPDGHWLAFQALQSGRWEVFVLNVENPATRFQVSTDGGAEPLWAADGRSVIYRASNQFVSASLVLSPRFEVTRREALFPDLVQNGASIGREYDLNRRTGELVVLARRPGERERIVVVTGWLDELKERTAPAVKK